MKNLRLVLALTIALAALPGCNGSRGSNSGSASSGVTAPAATSQSVTYTVSLAGRDAAGGAVNDIETWTLVQTGNVLTGSVQSTSGASGFNGTITLTMTGSTFTILFQASTPTLGTFSGSGYVETGPAAELHGDLDGPDTSGTSTDFLSFCATSS